MRVHVQHTLSPAGITPTRGALPIAPLHSMCHHRSVSSSCLSPAVQGDAEEPGEETRIRGEGDTAAAPGYFSAGRSVIFVNAY